MKKSVKFFTIVGIIVASMLLVTGCMSTMMNMAAGIMSAMFKDYGVYDASVPADQQSNLRFVFVKIKSFDGKPVDWEGSGANNMGKVSVPSGKHKIVFDWMQEKQTGSSYNSYNGTTTYTYTTKSLKDISMDIDLTAGHSYMLSGNEMNGDLSLQMQDMTYNPSALYGDEVPDAPKASTTPTEFEGTWNGPGEVQFVFAGNTWTQTMPPTKAPDSLTDAQLSSMGVGSDRMIYTTMSGTFLTKDNVLTLVITQIASGGPSAKPMDMSALKQATIYHYKFDNGALILEQPGAAPAATYTKQ
ncbi:MAG: hypothetical protein LBM77_10535 [Spirochaetaceae bacterium]|jgi:hypothetical protein|nr:hypothetical protein [Spirochaetaceae bacterium]